MLYPASVIDRMPGGFSGLMRSLELVQRIAGSEIKGLSYLMPVHFQHSSLGFEVVLRGKIGSTHHFDQPMHTKLYKKYPTIRSVFVNEPSKFMNSVFGFAAKLLQTGVLVTDISRPCLWVRAADSNSHYFLGLHTFVELNEYPSMTKASLAWAVNDLELGASQEKIKKHFQAVTTMVGVTMFKDVAVLNIPAVVDTSMSSTMVWDHKEVLNALHTLALEKKADIVDTIRGLISPTTEDYEEDPKAMVGVGLHYAIYIEECCNSIKVSRVTLAFYSAISLE